MFAGMTVPSSQVGNAMAEIWLAEIPVDLSFVAADHAAALAAYFPALSGARSDAVVAETRRHLGGCLTAIETGLRLALAREPGMADILAALPEPLCWPMVCAQPGLISPALLAHMRLRAGVSLILREQGKPSGEADDLSASVDIGAQADHATREAATLLALAEWHWAVPGGERQPLRPDLPAEHYAELVWTAVACILKGLRDHEALGGTSVLDACQRSASTLLSRHDEAASPIAVAHRLVHLLGPRADGREWLGRALGERRFLLFAALAGNRLQLDPERLIAILFDGALARISVLCSALGGSGADFRHLLLTLRAVRPSLTDEAIVDAAERYDELNERDIASAMALLRAPALLGVKLDCLRYAPGGR
jgi:hypothetical protein